MNNRAGDYNQTFVWLQRTSTRDSSYGQRQETFTPSSTVLWGHLEDLSGAERIDYGFRQTSTDCKIRIRGYPAVNAKDRLQHKVTGELYGIDAVTKTPNMQEIVVYCTRQVQP